MNVEQTFELNGLDGLTEDELFWGDDLLDLVHSNFVAEVSDSIAPAKLAA